MSVPGIQVIVLGTSALIREFGWKGGYSPMILIMPLFYVFLITFLNFCMKGYSLHCVSDIDFRNSVINSLNRNSIKFEEKMNKMELTDIDNELNIFFTSWVGIGMVKIKNKKDKIIFKKIIDGMKIYFNENNMSPRKTAAVFYLIFGVFFGAVGISLATLLSVINRFGLINKLF
jgi:hypothetical protein